MAGAFLHGIVRQALAWPAYLGHWHRRGQQAIAKVLVSMRQAVR